MREKIDYLENKSRQNNIRIYQVKEGAEGADMAGFVTRLITETLGIPATELFVTAAHRSLTSMPSADAPPRSIVVRFLQWNTRQRVLQSAWKKRNIRLGETQIYFDRDYSQKVQQERALYAPLRRQLREKNIKSHILFPTKLKVFTEDHTTIFNSPEEAIEELMAQGLLKERPPPAKKRLPKSSLSNSGLSVDEKKMNELLKELQRRTLTHQRL
ncbi:hypothetical protein WMY93_021442 [Mugilogobius chulae]